MAETCGSLPSHFVLKESLCSRSNRWQQLAQLLHPVAAQQATWDADHTLLYAGLVAKTPVKQNTIGYNAAFDGQYKVVILGRDGLEAKLTRLDLQAHHREQGLYGLWWRAEAIAQLGLHRLDLFGRAQTGQALVEFDLERAITNILVG